MARSRLKTPNSRLAARPATPDSTLAPHTPSPGRQESPAVTQDINVLALVKGTERYIFLYDDSSRGATLRMLGRYASDPELSFSWYDAAVLSQKIRQESRKTEVAERFQLPLPTDQEELF
jgi:hypothetical protein